MQTRFLHSADWQLGKPFASIRDDAKRFQVQQERLQAIRRIALIARERGAAFVLVAGDLFDSPHATRATVSAACSAIGEIGVPVIVIPGNHDHAGIGSIWEQEFYLREQHQLAPNLKVLLKPEPVVLDSAVLFPAPLLRRHDTGNPTAWIRDAVSDPSLPDDRSRIVLAHGSVQGFSSLHPDEDGSPGIVNWIDLSGLPADAIDYVALGDWHGTKQVGPKAWYSGTPETDRFPKGAAYDPGNVLEVTVTRGQEPQVGKVSSGRLGWKEFMFRFSDDASLDLFASQLGELLDQRGNEHLLLLTLEGTLGLEAFSRLEKHLETWEARLLHLKLDQRVVIAPSEEETAALTMRTGDPLIASVATRLVARCHGETEDAAIARIALRELHAAL